MSNIWEAVGAGAGATLVLVPFIVWLLWPRLKDSIIECLKEKKPDLKDIIDELYPTKVEDLEGIVEVRKREVDYKFATLEHSLKGVRQIIMDQEAELRAFRALPARLDRQYDSLRRFEKILDKTCTTVEDMGKNIAILMERRLQDRPQTIGE